MKQDCPLCRGTGFVKEGKAVTLCNCRFSTDQINVILRIPKRYWKASLDDFIPENPSQYSALEESRSYCLSQDFKKGKGIVYTGPPSLGKTYLAVSVLKTIYLEFKVRGAFFDTKDLLFRLKSLMDTGMDKNLLRFLVEIPVLVLDDLGNERLSDWQREIISYIIVQRYNDVKATIITTNYPLRSQEEEDLEPLSERLGDSIISKIEEVNEIIRMEK